MFSNERKEQIEKDYRVLLQEFPSVFQEITEKLKSCEKDVSLAVQYLYTSMPISDMANYSFETFLDFAEHGVYLWNTKQAVRELPEDIFLNYVLHHRVNEEEIRPCRKLFYKKTEDRIKGMSIKEAAVEINFWCAEQVTYHSGDDRTLSALAVYERGYGRCGEESTFLVNVLRSVGIPARQVYVPRWSHCDDNHAWVELWCGGNWYFTGACEPLMILDQGWFTNAASRAMLVHSRLFDKESTSRFCENAGKEESAGKEGMVQMLNQLSRYAKTDRIEVLVLDKERHPVKDACVQFQVLNMGEYFTIAEKITDENGKADFLTGLGCIYLHAKKDGIFTEQLLDTREQKTCTVILQEQPLQANWMPIDMTAPTDTPVNTDMPDPEQTLEGKKRLQEANRIRVERTKDWINPEKTAFLQKDEKTAFYRKALLDTLTEKDQTDCIGGILEEHLEYGLAYKKQTDSKLFVSYVLNPRVEHEVLTKYRKEILCNFTEEEKAFFRDDPRAIWKIIQDRVKEMPKRERLSLLTAPAGCLKMGIGSLRSKKILFVAIARTLGIPARLDPVNGDMEYFENGKFVSVSEEKKKSCTLVLTSKDAAQWKYFQNWSIGKLEKEEYVSLDLSGAVWEAGKLEIALGEGRYRLITANRLPNGNIFTNQKELLLNEGERKSEELILRSANLEDMLENISMPEFFVRNEAGEKISSTELTENGKHILMWLQTGEEPTEHILNEMLEQKEEFESYAKKIIFMVQTKEKLQDALLKKVLETFLQISVYYDTFEENIHKLGRRMYVDHEKLPLILVTSGKQNGIYAASGYNVGTGDMLLRIMK